MTYWENELNDISAVIQKEAESYEDKGIWINVQFNASMDGAYSCTNSLAISPELFTKLKAIMLENEGETIDPYESPKN